MKKHDGAQTEDWGGGARNKSPAAQTLIFVSFVSHTANHVLSEEVSLMTLRKEILETGMRLLD